MIYPVATPEGLQLVLKTARHGLVTITSYVSTLRCGGATSTLLNRYARDLQGLAIRDPTRFAPYRGQGIRLADAIALLPR